MLRILCRIVEYESRTIGDISILADHQKLIENKLLSK
jgi:hypothetical protein